MPTWLHKQMIAAKVQWARKQYDACENRFPCLDRGGKKTARRTWFYFHNDSDNKKQLWSWISDVPLRRTATLLHAKSGSIEPLRCVSTSGRTPYAVLRKEDGLVRKRLTNVLNSYLNDGDMTITQLHDLQFCISFLAVGNDFVYYRRNAATRRTGYPQWPEVSDYLYQIK